MPKFLNQMMNEYDGGDTVITVKNVRLAAVLLCVLCVVVSLFFGNIKSFVLGIFLGGAVAQLLFRQHELTVDKMFDEGKNPQSITVSNYFVRLVIRAVTLVVAFKNPNVSIIGCILGLLSVPYGIYALAFADWIIHRKTGKEV